MTYVGQFFYTFISIRLFPLYSSHIIKSSNIKSLIHLILKSRSESSLRSQSFIRIFSAFVNLFCSRSAMVLHRAPTGAYIAYPMSIGSDMCANAFELVAHCHPRHVPFVGPARNTGWLVNLGSIIASRRVTENEACPSLWHRCAQTTLLLRDAHTFQPRKFY